MNFGRKNIQITGSDMISAGMNSINNAINLVVEGISHNNVSISNIEADIKELEEKHKTLVATNEKANRFVTNLNKLFE